MSSNWPLSWEPADESWLEWLATAGSDSGVGFDVGDMPDSAWVLHAMYERFDGVSVVVPDESAEDRPDRYQYLHDRDGNVFATLDFGNDGPRIDDGIPWPHDPGPEFRRLLWRDYARRSGTPLVTPGKWPGISGALPGLQYGGIWNGYIESPSEGYLDLESWTHLTDLLRRHSPQGDDTMCTAYYLFWTNNGAKTDAPFLFRGRLGDVNALISNPHYGWSPQNLWPDDHLWVMYSDWDLWATRLSGPSTLIEALLDDPFLEVDRLPDVPHTGPF